MTEKEDINHITKKLDISVIDASIKQLVYKMIETIEFQNLILLRKFEEMACYGED